MSRYKCIKEYLPQEFTYEDLRKELGSIKIGEIWELSNETKNHVSLIRDCDEDYYYWLKISREELREYFEEL